MHNYASRISLASYQINYFITGHSTKLRDITNVLYIVQTFICDV